MNYYLLNQNQISLNGIYYKNINLNPNANKLVIQDIQDIQDIQGFQWLRRETSVESKVLTEYQRRREPERKAEPKAVSVVSVGSPPTPPTPPTNNAMYHPSRYKIELCKNFLERGKCEFGDRCLFAHSANELRPCTYRHSKFKTQLCKPFHENGFCDFGSRCSFIHSKPDLYSIVNYLEMVLLSKIPMPENPNHQNHCKNTLLKNEQNVNSLNAYQYTSGELQSPFNRVKRSRLPAFTKLSPE